MAEAEEKIISVNGRFHILGDVHARGEMDLPTDSTLNQILLQHGKGLRLDKKRFKAVQIGGPLGPYHDKRKLNVPLSEILKESRSDFPNFLNYILFMDTDTCMVDAARFSVEFAIKHYKLDNPFVHTIHDTLERITKGKGISKDISLLKEYADEIKNHGDSEQVKQLAVPVLSSLQCFKAEYLDHINYQYCQTGVCRELSGAPCINACPAQINVPGYIGLICDNREEDAYRLMRKQNPFSAVCGTACPHPCEDKCRRNELDSAVNILSLKHYAAEKVYNSNTPFSESKLDENGKSVAIVGGGPSGLTCAYYLARSGYHVTVYEAESLAGGMMATGIPEYKTPMDLIQWEIDLISNLGVNILTNTQVGKDISFEDLEKEHNALYLATGGNKGISLELENEQSEGVWHAVDLLRKVKLNLYTKEKLPEIGKQVVVIGGGSVAVDAARTAKRLGAETVKMVCLEQRTEMPAWEYELEECAIEGIDIVNGFGPQKIVATNDCVTGVNLKQCDRVFDDDGAFNPVYREDKLISLDADCAILAVGQGPDTFYLDGVSGIPLLKNGCVEIEAHTMATEKQGVFAGGDLHCPGLLVEAVSAGRRAAESIHHYLGGKGDLYTGENIEIPTPQLDHDIWHHKRFQQKYCNNMQAETNSFTTVHEAMTTEEAGLETRRCFRCDRNQMGNFDIYEEYRY